MWIYYSVLFVDRQRICACVRVFVHQRVRSTSWSGSTTEANARRRTTRGWWGCERGQLRKWITHVMIESGTYIRRIGQKWCIDLCLLLSFVQSLDARAKGVFALSRQKVYICIFRLRIFFTYLPCIVPGPSRRSGRRSVCTTTVCVFDSFLVCVHWTRMYIVVKRGYFQFDPELFRNSFSKRVWTDSRGLLFVQVNRYIWYGWYWFRIIMNPLYRTMLSIWQMFYSWVCWAA